jgi:hypothetical protein
LSDPRTALRALEAALEADARWIEVLGQARTTDAWDQLLDPAWGPPPEPHRGGHRP